MFKATRFTVTSDMPFPFDMLRYDGCHPETEDDVSAMFKQGTRNVRLVMYHRPGEPEEPTRERWQSFLWNVHEGSIKQVS